MQSSYKLLTLILALILGLLLAVPKTTLAAEPTTDQVIIKLKDKATITDEANFYTKHQIKKLRHLDRLKADAVKNNRQNINDLINQLKNDPLVDYVEPDFIAQATEVPNDPNFSNQWGLEKIQSEYAWDTTHGAGDVDIAILDTGVDQNHPDLAGKVVGRINFTSAVDNNSDAHGTHVAGIAAAVNNNNLGGDGVSYNSRIISVKVLDNSGYGYYSGIANGITWAADNGAEVINLSIGGTSGSITLQNAINYAWNKGVVIVAAAGNNGTSQASYPGYYTNAIAVAATDQTDTKASFSNYGSWVDVAAPGVNILSTVTGGGYEYWSGTSMATPFVSGLAALIKGQHPDWNNTQIRNQIESTADKINKTGTYWSNGRINACKAVGCISAPTPTPTLTPTPVPTKTPRPTATPKPTPSPTSSPASTPASSPTASPNPSPSPKPWWCPFIPTYPGCV